MAFSASTDLLVSQWEHATRLRAVIDIGLDVLREEIDTPAAYLRRMMNLDTAEDIWLDRLGQRVGLPRPYSQTQSSGDRFGFDMAGVAFDQAPFAEIDSNIPLEPVPDVLYRKMIRARAVSILSKGTMPDFRRSALKVDASAETKDLFDMSVLLRTDDSFCMQLALDNEALALTAGVKPIRYLWSGSLFTIAHNGSDFYMLGVNSNSIFFHDTGDALSQLIPGFYNVTVPSISYDRRRSRMMIFLRDPGKITTIVNELDNSFTIVRASYPSSSDLISLNITAMTVSHDDSILYLIGSRSNGTAVLYGVDLPLAAALPTQTGTLVLDSVTEVIGAAHSSSENAIYILTESGHLHRITISPLAISLVGRTDPAIGDTNRGLGYDDDNDLLYMAKMNQGSIDIYLLSTEDGSSKWLYNQPITASAQGFRRPRRCLAYAPFVLPRNTCTAS